QGQWNRRTGKRRGTPAWDLPGRRFVTFLENHDQVAHSGRGQRPQYLTSPGRYRAMTTVWLLAPGTPLFFQGQEFWSSAPFLFFADHHPELAELVRKGRNEFLREFHSLSGSDCEAYLADPGAWETFQRCKLDFGERQRHAEIYRMHRELLRLRRDDPVFAAQNGERIEGAVLGAETFVLRYLGGGDGDRLLLVNLGRSFECNPASEPLLAPPDNCVWKLMFSSDDPRYGGAGTALPDETRWLAPSHAALAFRSESL
ncbi:MAG TPA: DUF3459 domain-containing protein, partial [Pirellulales bacterium]|nr:DUF3459 domain-containing protein [Pirellulales bacterium]